MKLKRKRDKSEWKGINEKITAKKEENGRNTVNYENKVDNNNTYST